MQADLMPVAFVAGANGAIGRHCVRLLLERGWTVGGIGHGDVRWNSSSAINAWIAGEVSAENLDILANQVGVPELFVNLAGGSSVGPSLSMPLNDFERTVSTGVRILEWTRRNAPNAALSFASSAAVYGDRHDQPIREDSLTHPLSPYGHHKLMMEENARFWSRSFGVRTAVVRLFSVYGPGLQKQLVHELCSRIAGARSQLVLSGTGNESRDWVWIEDAASMMIDLGMLASQQCPTFNGCTGVATSVAEVASRIADAWGVKVEVTFDGYVRSGDPAHLVGDTERLQAARFRSVVDFASGIERFVAAVRSEAAHDASGSPSHQ